MRFHWVAFYFVGVGAACASFLQPTYFPKTVDDMPLVDRMALKADAYAPFESEYDDAGNCISGCSYAMPRWEDELAAMERWNALSHQELINVHGYTENPDGSITPPPMGPTYPVQIEFPDPDTPNPPTTPPTTPPITQPDVPPSPPVVADCQDKNNNFEDRNIPYKNPLGYTACITSPYGPRTLNGRKFHYGIDFRSPIGTPVYAPANGTVVSVFVQNKTCGNGVVIEHSNGYSTKYCHMDSVSVAHGDKLSAGCLIGKSGNTGQSTGPHLHYAVLKNGNAVNPVDFIEPGHKNCN